MLLGKKSKLPAQEGARQIGLLGMDTRFKGKVRFRGTLRIDGQVEGSISAEEGSGSVLVINQNAVVTGDIVSDSVLISGSVLGNIKASEKVELFRTGILKGDVFTNDIIIQGGAEYEGNCHMIKNLSAVQRQKTMDTAFPVTGESNKNASKALLREGVPGIAEAPQV